MNAIKIEILGSGCKKCQQLEANAKEAVANLNLTAVVLHITGFSYKTGVHQHGIITPTSMGIII